jgi:hypothetical protein
MRANPSETCAKTAEKESSRRTKTVEKDNMVSYLLLQVDKYSTGAVWPSLLLHQGPALRPQFAGNIINKAGEWCLQFAGRPWRIGL